jgi:hypothetical protein
MLSYISVKKFGILFTKRAAERGWCRRRSHFVQGFQLKMEPQADEGH